MGPGTVSPAATTLPSTTPADVPRALTTRFLDFWLLGGASILVWAVMAIATPLRQGWGIDQQFRNLAFTTLSLALVVNYPHFMLSYKLAYGRGRRFILTHWWQLLAVPALLALLLGVTYVYFERPAQDVPLLARAAQLLRAWGVNAQVVAGPRVGDVLLTAAFNLMVLTIGWHYTRQVFGCMMVYAHFDGYALSPAQRRLTKSALFSVWMLTIIDNNLDGTFRQYAGFAYSSFDMPDLAHPIAQAIVGLGFLLVAHQVFYANYRATGRPPSVNMVVPFVAIYVWWLPLTRQQEFYLLLTPLFHSLQYLAFAYKMEHGRLQGASYRDARGTAVIVGVVLAGWLAFELLPGAADTRLATVDRWGFYFCVTAAMLFINIHHYFIDNAIWRFHDADVRRYLLTPANQQ